MSMTSTEFQMFQSQSQSIQEEPHERGVWRLPEKHCATERASELSIVHILHIVHIVHTRKRLRYPGYSMAGPPAGSSLLIVCFGDAKRGQLGVDHRVRRLSSRAPRAFSRGVFFFLLRVFDFLCVFL